MGTIRGEDFGIPQCTEYYVPIRGDRLLLALKAIGIVYAYGDATSCDYYPPWSPKRIVETMQSNISFPSPECVWKGEHRGGRSIGLSPLFEVLRHSRGLENAQFNLYTIVEEFLGSYDVIARSVAYHEWESFWEWFRRIASGELTDADFQKN